MKSAAFTESAGQQFAEAVIAATLTLPLVFAFAVLNGSQWVRGVASVETAGSFLSLDSTGQPVQTLNPTPVMLDLRSGDHRAVDAPAETTVERKISKFQDSTKVTRPAPGIQQGAQGAAAVNRDNTPAHQDTSATLPRREGGQWGEAKSRPRNGSGFWRLCLVLVGHATE